MGWIDGAHGPGFGRTLPTPVQHSLPIDCPFVSVTPYVLQMPVCITRCTDRMPVPNESVACQCRHAMLLLDTDI